MMKNILISLVFCLSACDASPPPQPQTEARQPNPAFETQIQAMEKARAVEGQVMNAANAQRKQMGEKTQ